MKKLLIALLGGVILFNSAYAFDALLRVKVKGNIQKTHYICVSNVGCLNLAASVKGRTFPMQLGNVQHIFLADISNLRMYPQTLPASCDVVIKNNQTLTVSGSVGKAVNNNLYINNLKCTID